MRISPAILALTFFLPGAFHLRVSQAQPACALMGDLNLDELNSAADIPLFLDCAFGIGGECACGDMNLDSQTNLDDLALFVDVLLHEKGACCLLTDHSCSITNFVTCQSSGRVYLGDQTVCTVNPCFTPPLKIVTPQDGEMIAGTNSLVWAAVPDIHAPDGGPTLEFSLNGLDFLPLPNTIAPDMGKNSTTTAIDVEEFPTGPFYIRASTPTEQVIHQVLINHLPRIRCSVGGAATSVELDCSASTDPDGSIVSYQWNFGDGGSETTSDPVVFHHYDGPGEYGVELFTCDDQGFCNNETFLVTVSHSAQVPPLLGPPTMCCCESMVLRFKQGVESKIKDRRPRSNPPPPPAPQTVPAVPAPLGTDGIYVSFNFEIDAKLKEKSDRSCPQGQEVNRTATVNDQVPASVEKKCACVAGRDSADCSKRPNPNCNLHDGCDTLRCSGGARNGMPVNDAVSRWRCMQSGGQIAGNNDGQCQAFPYAPRGALGNDDYRSPSTSNGVKSFIGDGRIVWLDAPGFQWSKHPHITASFEADYEFKSFVLGRDGGADCDCICHFRLHLKWNGTRFTDARVKLVKDGLSKKCTCDPPCDEEP